LDIRGRLRFDAEFAIAVDLMGCGRIDVKSLISASVPFREALDAFNLSGDRSRSVKVQLTFA
jgi:L-idonate 5-dehydrogenase